MTSVRDLPEGTQRRYLALTNPAFAQRLREEEAARAAQAARLGSTSHPRRADLLPEVAEVLGVAEGTVRNDLGAQNYAPEPIAYAQDEPDGAQNCAPEPEVAVFSLHPPALPEVVVRAWGACLLCGIGAVRVSAQEVEAHFGGSRKTAKESVWTVLSASPSSLGAVYEGEKPVLGHVCPPCQQAITDEGGEVGQGALARALVVALVPEMVAAGIVPDLAGVEAVRGWGGRYADAKHLGVDPPVPNARAFEHEGDAVALVERLRAGLEA